MNELARLLALIPDGKQEEAKSIAELIKATFAENETKIGEYESKMKDAIKGRDEVKKTLKSVAKDLGAEGVDNIKDAIEVIKSSGLKSETEAIKALKDELSNRDSEITDIKRQMETQANEYSTQIKTYAFQNEYANLATKMGIVPKLMPILAKDIMDKVVFEDDKVKLVNEDGTTMRINNKDADLAAYLEQLKNEETESKEFVFFENKVQPSGASGTAQGGTLQGGDTFVPGSTTY